MWATAGSPYDVSNIRPHYGSMKWHLVDETSIEYREIEIHWAKKIVTKPFGYLNCGRKNLVRPAHSFDTKMLLVLKDTVNLNQSNVCTYCRKARKKELNIEDKVEG